MAAKVVLDSIGPNGKRLISVEATYWRAIHAEIMTHRDRARNAASSRAIPFIRYTKCDYCGGMGITPDGQCPKCQGSKEGSMVPNCTYSKILNDPFMPEFIGSEQKGMQSGEDLTDPKREQAVALINKMRNYSLECCKHLFDLGVHKSIINRYLEPWSYITIIMTATEWKNFFRLRVHPKAEKHFNKLAKEIQDAIAASTPTPLKSGEWHMPYLRQEERELMLNPYIPECTKVLGGTDHDWWGKDIIQIMKKVSAARCARLSYLTHDGVCSVKDDLRIFETLIEPKHADGTLDDTIHSSPLEHVAQASSRSDLRSGPFLGWKQFRKEFANENVEG